MTRRTVLKLKPEYEEEIWAEETCEKCKRGKWTCHCKSCGNEHGMAEWVQYHCTSCIRSGGRMMYDNWICNNGVRGGIIPAAKVFYPDDSMYEPDC